MRGIIPAEPGFGKRDAFAVFISPWLAGVVQHWDP
jgi:hypothetical protein